MNLELLARRASPALLGVALVLTGCRADVGGRAETGTLLVRHAVAPAPPAGAEGSAFLIVENRGSRPVALVDVRSPDADSVQLHEMSGGRMRQIRQVEVPARGRVLFVPGQYHLMLVGLRHPLATGDTLTLGLRFASGDTLTVRVPVLRYGDAVRGFP